ncbi:unnamed protein product, partial [Adineta steineri]
MAQAKIIGRRSTWDFDELNSTMASETPSRK